MRARLQASGGLRGRASSVAPSTSSEDTGGSMSDGVQAGQARPQRARASRATSPSGGLFSAAY
eukprot:10833350-Lingulodinium_polyedra.AAC.1